jgi:hypothetical protein
MVARDAQNQVRANRVDRVEDPDFGQARECALAKLMSLGDGAQRARRDSGKGRQLHDVVAPLGTACRRDNRWIGQRFDSRNKTRAESSRGVGNLKRTEESGG